MTLELSHTFDVLRGRCGAPDALEYFVDLAKTYFGLLDTERRKEALIVGNSFPEELLWANQVFPHWVIGGSLSLCSAIDSRVPRDADSISRSAFGYLENYLPDTDQKTPILIPVTGDNQRKIAYLLQEEGRNVIPISIPPETQPSKLYSLMADQLNAVLSDLTPTWNLPGASKRLRNAAQMVARAKSSASALMTQAGQRIDGMLRMFLLNTYFYAGDLAQWAQNLDRLVKELQAAVPEESIQKKPGVLIVGSPVLFPNYKVPILLESAGLSILGSCDYLSGKVLSAETELPDIRRGSLLRRLVKHTYEADCSGAFVSNRALYNQVSHLLEVLDVRGVIFHIIKGQIEYDFELEHLEPLLSKHKLPVFRLETDYHDNDVEQLRIRLEAFAELLMQDVDNDEKNTK